MARKLMAQRILRKHQRLQSRTAAGPDCSEIGPYLGSLRATSRGVTINSALPGHLRGKAISPKAPRPQTWTTAEPDRRRAGPLGDRSLPRKSSGYIQGFYHKLSLAWHLRGKAISPKAPRPQTWTTAEPDCRRAGPLGDRSLPRRVFLGGPADDIWRPTRA